MDIWVSMRRATKRENTGYRTRLVNSTLVRTRISTMNTVTDKAIKIKHMTLS